jgi:signal transduction histidine kinase
MASLNQINYKLGAILLKYRWWFIALLGLSAILFELHEYRHIGYNNLHFFREIIFFGFVYPLAIGLLINMAIRAEAARSGAQLQRQREQALNQKLANVHNWEELIATILNFPQQIAPILGASLFVREQEQGVFRLVSATWITHIDAWPESPPLQTAEFDHAPRQTPTSLYPISLGTGSLNLPLHAYCLPLLHGDLLVAMLHLYLLPTVNLTADQIETLNHVAPIMGMALDGAVPTNPAFVQAAAAAAERQRIARQLHDTLAQDMAYLRFKLEQITDHYPSQQLGEIQPDLEQLRDLSYELHQQVRQTLVLLNAKNQQDLQTALLAHARAAGESGGFRLTHTIQGNPVELPSQAEQNILFIFKEALTNAEKHAHAGLVELYFVWTLDSLTIKVKDDGIGFDPTAVQPDTHFGLTIMRQRAQTLNASLKIISAPNQGTAVEMVYPIL